MSLLVICVSSLEICPFKVFEIQLFDTMDPSPAMLKSLRSSFEQDIMNSVKQTEQGAYITLEPDKTQRLMNSLKKEVEKLENLGKNPIVVTSPIVRMYFKKLTRDYFSDLIVISYNEIESNVELQSVGMVTE